MTRAIILAAGMGTRISDDIGAIPKSTLEIDGVPIIRRTAEALLALSAEVTVCTGYKPEMVKAALDGLAVGYCHNPFFSVANNIASLWVARDLLEPGDDAIVVSGDVAVGDGFFERLAGTDAPIAMTVDSTAVAVGDEFFKLDGDGHVLEHGADLEEAKRDVAYIGHVRVSGDAVAPFVARLEEIVAAGGIQEYFEQVAWSFIGDGQLWPVGVDMAGIPWVEIDRIGDYKRALGELEARHE